MTLQLLQANANLHKFKVFPTLLVLLILHISNAKIKQSRVILQWIFIGAMSLRNIYGIDIKNSFPYCLHSLNPKAKRNGQEVKLNAFPAQGFIASSINV